MESKIKVIIKRPDEPHGHVTNISQSLKNLQNTVEGYVESVRISEIPGTELLILCNEDGRRLGLEKNCRVCGVDFVGTIIVAGTNGDALGDVPISLKTWREMIAEGAEAKS